MVVVSDKRGEIAPLLPTTRRSQEGSRSLAGAVALVAVFAVAALVTLSSSVHQPVVLSGDGVEPVDQLSFTQGEAVHMKGPKRMDDVAARMAMSGYYDSIGHQQAKAHKLAMKQSSDDSRKAMNDYFDHLGQQYHKLAQSEKAQRVLAHPGKLDIHRSKSDQEMAKDEQIVMSKVSEGVTSEIEMAKSSGEAKKHSPESGEAKKHSPESGEAKTKGPAPKKGEAKSSGEAKQPAPEKGEAKQPAPEKGEAKKQPSSLAITGDKVKVGFYMESMCPGCKYFTTHVLSELLKDGDFNQMVDFKLYPYGNGDLNGDNIACQHGLEECKGNQILACMQHLHPITESSTGFVETFVCMEGKDGLPKDEFADCALTSGLTQPDVDAINACADGDEGKQLALAAARATESLDPPHEYAPWVTLNGKPLRDDAYELQEQVCDAYDGSQPAALCSSSELRTVKQSLHDVGFSICPKDAGVV
eukprot:CAMPEP_0181310708 /NCGR_PEP_ID=MMETSP1101-20121128/12734_1 /TAXON_ID=46948 /ORGANISM="Rhodomonas abbreviata, Strain Caron Lab Isolate" /LENGTH=471 /DNA_ID=CAMNT_0023417363 /DNA_START=16 /DNA_END=1431 /DNA_ORIENTATION=+